MKKLLPLATLFTLLSLGGVGLDAIAEETSESPKDFWHWDTMTGNWGGHRDKLADKGVNFEFVYTGEVGANVAGGIKRSGNYLDNIDMGLAVDLEKLVHWKGASLYIYGVGNQGDDPTADTGDAQGVSNIEAPDFWRLQMAWLQQNLFDDRLSLLAGILDLNSEFDALEYASLFINSSHVIGPDYSQSGANGPSVFPYTSLAGRITVKPLPYLYIKSAVFDGVPGDPTDPWENGIHFKSGEGLLISNEIGFTPGDLHEGARYGKFALGNWIYTSKFDDLVDTTATGDPSQRTNYGFYGEGEYKVYNEDSEGEQGLGLFARIGYANPDINPFKLYLGLGLNYTGLFPTRDEDQMGLALATAFNGGKFKTAQSTAGAPVESAEYNLELTYHAQILPWFAVQPSIQYVINPGTDPSLNNAFYMLTRFEFTL